MKIREYKNGDLDEMLELFYDTVHNINVRDYTEEQVNMWAPKKSEKSKWREYFNKNYCYVAIIDKKIVGFSDLTREGYLNTIYIHKDFQRKGIATELLGIIEKKAKKLNIDVITTEASITAKPFFKNKGFNIVKEQTKYHKGLIFINYIMEKKIKGGDLMKNILNRRSIRKYKNKKVCDEKIEKLLRAAMAAPSAGNEQPWEFIVVRDKNKLKGIINHHKYANMLNEANVAIVVCGDINRERYEGFWVQDCSAATQNILLAAESQGLGAVWLGVYPKEDREKGIRKVLSIPDNINILSVVSIGYPNEEKKPSDRYDEERIHYNKW